MKGIRVPKIVNEIKIEGVWSELETKTLFPETIIHKISAKKPSLHLK